MHLEPQPLPLVALTKRQIDAAEYDPDGPAQQIVYDGDLPAFGVRLFPSGVKSFVLRYRPVGSTRPKMLTIGKYGVLTLHQARQEAQRRLLEVRTGGDPVESRRKARAAATVREFADIYMERHAKRHKKSWKLDQAMLDSHVLPALGHLKLEDVQRSHVATLHARIGAKWPTQANRVLSLISLLFNLATDWGHLPADAPNPARRIKRYKEASRDRWVTPAELPTLMEAIAEEGSPYVRAALLLYLLTGLRKHELLRAEWSGIDFDRAEWRLPDTKAGRSHVVPLSPPAVEILRALPREQGNAHVFPGTRAGRPMNGIQKVWERVRARLWIREHPTEAAALRVRAEADVRARPKHASHRSAAVDARLLQLVQAATKGEDHLRIHDLRRTVGSWLATSGASLPLIGRILNHSNVATTQVYARLADSTARAALEEHGARILRLTSRRRAPNRTPVGGRVAAGKRKPHTSRAS